MLLVILLIISQGNDTYKKALSLEITDGKRKREDKIKKKKTAGPNWMLSLETTGYLRLYI